MARKWPRAIRYLNWQGETIDSIDSDDYPDRSAFLVEMTRLRNEYAIAGMSGAVWQRKEL